MSLQAIARKLADTNELGSLEDKTRFGTSAKSLDSRIHKREEKELRRVFDFLTLFKERHKIEAALEQRQQALKQKKAFLGACVDKRHLQGSLVTLTPELLADEMKELAKDISEFEKMLKRLKERPNRKIGKADLSEAIRVTLGKAYSKKEVDDMVWEADESLDGLLDWEEVKYYFVKTIEDETGLEPRSLFDVIQFMMFDTNMDGIISVDDTMEILFHRYSREALDKYIRNLFGDALDLPFADYHARVTKHHQELLKGSS